MVWVELAVVLVAIFLGARLGSVAIGMAGGLGVLALGVLGVPVKFADIPFDVIGIIMSVIAAISAMQMAGGLEWLVALADKLLRKKPNRVTLYAPLITYFMTLMAGTGHTAFSTLPVIAEVAKENKVRPSRPLSISVVSSQVAITASPVSAATVLMADLLEPKGVSYLQLLAVAIPSSLIAVVAVSFVAARLGKPLEQDEEYQRRLAAGMIKHRGATDFEPPKGARASVLIFLAGIICVMAYATIISPSVGWIKDPWIPRTEGIMITMLAVATVIVMVGRFEAAKVASTSTFRSGMSASVCVLGVAWLGTTFVNHNEAAIMDLAGNVLASQPWLLAVVLFFASALLYSQAATAKALVPTAIAMGVPTIGVVASFAAVSGLFVLPTYPTLIAAVEMDETGSTRIGRFVFNHPFMIPGVLTIAGAVALAFALGAVIL
ncbi:MAG: anaerobic C4-dicarboxylate transporter [Bifidobacteriaceae bacterium]|jgi:anaerobic C4-dicarboxylate transporter DcuA|nr:anaerobic C4-dicarboxylate transporter [Bifidobacteriaceae bacterium]